MLSITKKTETDALYFPLPLFNTKVIAEAINGESEAFDIVVGLDEKMVMQIKERSLDDTDEELKVTSDRERFGTSSYEKWYKKNRTPFALIHKKSNTLAALVWFGAKPLGRKPPKLLSAEERKKDEYSLDAKNWHTLSYRSYKPFRGKGLMKDFTRYAIKTYLEKFPDARLWGGVDVSNAASFGFAKSIGFKTLEESPDPNEHWLVMIRNTINN